jgi:hypothetical protein
MSTHGTRESCCDRSTPKKSERTFWVAVLVERGFPTEARAFRKEELARLQEKRWRKGMNTDYDDADVFEVEIEDTIVQ